MSDESLTPHDFLRMSRTDVEQVFEESLPQSVGKPYFEPGLYAQLTNPLLSEMKSWKIDGIGRAAERKSILNWVIPMVLVGPFAISFIMTGLSVLTSSLLTLCAVAVITFFWFFGRVWRWETRNFEEGVINAENAIDKTLRNRVRQWAAERYTFNTSSLEWTQFSEFYIQGVPHRWEEKEEGKYVIIIVETGEEPPMLETAVLK